MSYPLRAIRPLAERFWEKVDRQGDCWRWLGAHTTNGYGRVGRPRREGGAYVHRVSWELHFGPIPVGMVVCHACDVRDCVRPTHLFLGTQAANLADMHAKGRQADTMKTRHFATDNGRAVLDWPRVRAIRDLYATGLWTIADVARIYSVGETTIRNIVKNRRWRDEVRPRD